MKSEKLLDAIGMVGEDLITNAKAPKKHMNWKHWAAIAACFTLIISTFTIWKLATKPQSDISRKPLEISITKIELSAAPENAYIGNKPFNPKSSLTSSPHYYFLYVTAKATEILPDTYCFYGRWGASEFRLIKMEAIRTIYGENIPHEFYLILREEEVVDLTQYNALILTHIRQYTMENCAIYNISKETPSVMDFPILGTPSFTGGSSIYAFTDNVFDESLWTINEAWRKHTELAREDLDKPSARINRNTTLTEAEAVINEDNQCCHKHRVESMKDIRSSDGIAAIQYISSSDSIFAPDYDFRTNNQYRRYIDGIPTNETIYISDDPKYSGEAFTDSDLSFLPPVASAIICVENAFLNGEIAPPHIADYSNLELISHGVTGWYFKSQGTVYAVIQINFTYRNPDSASLFDTLNDDMYFLMEYNSNVCREIDRDELLAFQGTKDFIFTGDYNDKGKVPADWM